MHIALDRLLHDAEHDLLAIAKCLVKNHVKILLLTSSHSVPTPQICYSFCHYVNLAVLTTLNLID